MANTAKRKRIFILGFFAVMALAVGLLLLRDIPAPITEKTVEISHVELTKSAAE